MSEKYEELVIEGPYPLIKGFIAGVVWARGEGEEVYFSREHHIIRGDLKEAIKEWMAFHGHLAHVVARDELAEAIVRAVDETKEDVGLEVRSRRAIRAACFRFSYHAYAKRYGTELKGLFSDLEEGVVLSEDYSPKEVEHPEAVGEVEAYAPEHAYEIEGKGTVAGPLIAILRLHKRARAQALIELEEVELVWE